MPENSIGVFAFIRTERAGKELKGEGSEKKERLKEVITERTNRVR